MKKKIDPQALANVLGMYLTMDKNGYWYVYEYKPTCGVSVWSVGFGSIICLGLGGRDVLVDYDGDWKDSLFSPQEEGCEFCKDGETILEDYCSTGGDSAISVVRINDYEREIVLDTECGRFKSGSTRKISYCSFCGRKL